MECEHDWSLKTYQMAESPPPPMSWQEYEPRLRSQWNLILDQNATDERAIHSFLERHPCLLPGAFSFPPSGHYPVWSGVISRPPLSADGHLIPDFMWIAVSSSTLWPVVIEIEAPSKRWFNKGGKPTHEFIEASTQLTQWKAWFNKPANQQIFLNTFQVPPEYQRDLEFRPQFVLIYGRRREFDDSPSLRRLRAPQQREDEYHLTFDRLTPQYDSRNLICLRKGQSGLKAVAVPPTLVFGPGHAHAWCEVSGRKEAIAGCEWMTAARKEFLISRLAYWDSWVKLPHHGITAHEEE